MTRPLRSLYYLVFLGLLLLLPFLELVLDGDPLDLFRAPLDVTFYSLLVSSYLRLF
jgi:hypothetical protein